MTNYTWRNNPRTIAKLVNTENIQTYRNRQVVLKPNEACAIVVNGRIGDIVTETILKNMAGGFSRWAGDKLGITATDRRLLFAMTSPMDYWIPFEGQIANGESVTGFANLRLRIDLENVPKLLNYFANNGTVLTRDMVERIISTELKHRVIDPCLAMCENSSALRSEKFVSLFELNTDVNMRNLLTNLGFTILKSYPVTNKTEMELVRRHGAALDAKMTTHSLNVNARIRELSLDESLTIAQLNRDNNIARVRAKGEVTVEVERELKDLRAEEAVWEAETNASRKKMQVRIDEGNAKAERAIRMFDEEQSRKSQRINSRNKFQTEILTLAANHGVLTPDVLLEVLKHQKSQEIVSESNDVME